MIWISETRNGYLARTFELREALLPIAFGLILLPVIAAFCAAASLRPATWILGLVPLVLVAFYLLVMRAAWKRKPWLELDLSCKRVRWSRGVDSPEEVEIDRFTTESVDAWPPGFKLHRLIAVKPEGRWVALEPDWVTDSSKTIVELAAKLNHVIRESADGHSDPPPAHRGVAR